MSHLDNLLTQDKKPQVQVSCSMSEAERDMLDNLLKAHGGVPRNQFVAACVRDGIEQLRKRPIPEAQQDGGDDE